ncbi:olfactory receptor 2A25-like [Engystomops pustulosus]|uniref:olfactory receptor 2A25-like n=1 Tax=Engystomops pustulosus TaxID=76066 RepID=UPI003AFA4E9A
MTDVTEFILLGFQATQNIRILMFVIFIVVYILTVFMNLLIIVLVSTSKNLHTPMYFFLTQLSLNDIILPTVIIPNMLHILLYDRGTIPFMGCMAQVYFFCVSEASECLILTLMSCDRYLAICNPLRYTSLMTPANCVILAVTCWFIAFFLMLLLIITMLMLNFCGPNIIDHFFCDTLPILELSCSDTYNLQVNVPGLVPTMLRLMVNEQQWSIYNNAKITDRDSIGRCKVALLAD